MIVNQPPFFESLASPERHIDRMYTVARLRGVKAAHPSNCKVLEIGCGRGTNLIPQALRYPMSEFIGVDIDANAIGQAHALLQKLEVQNCQCIPVSIEEFTHHTTEAFDYVICHGLFAWADSLVRRAILDLCSSRLSAVGIALISYNTLPGWYMRGILAHYVQADDDESLNVAARLERVRLHFDNLAKEESGLSDVEDGPDDPMTKEIKACKLQSEGFLWHEILNKNSRGFYLRQLVDLFAVQNLFFIGDSLPARMRWWRYDELVEELEVPELRKLEASYLEKEQQLDHILPIPFRSSLFSATEPLSEGGCDNSEIIEMHVSSHLVPLSERPDLVSEKQEIFCAPNSVSTEIGIPILKAALVRLRGAWPEAVPFSELLEHAAALSGVESAEHSEQLAKELSKLYFANMLELHPEPIQCTGKLGETPKADTFAREQAAFSSWVTTTRHEYQPIDRLECQLLNLLDGQRSKVDIIRDLSVRLQELGISPSYEGERIEDVDEVSELIQEHVHSSLELFRERGLLVD